MGIQPYFINLSDNCLKVRCILSINNFFENFFAKFKFKYKQSWDIGTLRIIILNNGFNFFIKYLRDRDVILFSLIYTY